MRLIALMMLPLMIACPTTKPEDDTGTIADDSGTTGNTYFEPGCITVDGGGGYKYLQDAITAAADGSVIVLCDGTYEEAVTVDKAVEIAGASRGGVILSAPAASAALTITGSGVDVHTLTIQSGKDGVVFEAGASGRVADFSMDAVSNYSVSFAGPADATVEDCAITNSAYTAIKANGGRATVARCTISNSASVAVDILGGADVVLDSNIIEGVTATTEEDGNAILADGSTLTMLNNQILGADGFGVNADATDVSMTGDTIQDTIVAVRVVDGEFAGSGLTITENLLLGMILANPGSISLSDSVISVADNSACVNDYAGFWTDGSIACGGVYAGGLTMDFSNVTVSGYDTYGMMVITYDGTATQTLNNVTLSNTGRVGLVLTPGEGEATITGGSITGTREIELPEPCADGDAGQYSLNYSAALYLLGGAVTIDGMDISDNTGWGIAASETTTNLRNSTLSQNGCAGIVNLVGSLNADNNHFTGGRQLGAVWDYGGSTVLTNNTFSDSLDVVRYEFEPYIYEYSGYGLDVQAYTTSSVVIDGNTFENGEQSLSISQVGSVQVSNNTWSNYNGVTLNINDCGSATLENNSVTGSYGYTLSAYNSSYATLELSGLTVTDSRPSSTSSRTFDRDGNLVDEYSYESTAYEMIYASSLGLDITDLTISGIDTTYVLYAFDSAIAVDGASLDDAYSFLYGSWSASAPDVLLENVEIGTMDYTLAQIYNYTASTGTVVVQDSSVASASTGLMLYGQLDVELDGFTLDSATGNGLTISTLSTDVDGDGLTDVLTADHVRITDTVIGTAGTYGALIAAGDVEIDGLDIGYAYVDGINITAPLISITGSDAASLVGNGVTLTGGDLDVTGNNFSGNSGYGMVCNGVTITACSGNDLTGNLLGTHLGCDDACGM